MSLEEVGALHLLLNHQWVNGDIPADPQAIAFILGRGVTLDYAQELLSGRLGRKFLRRRTGRLYNKRLDLERVAQQKRREERSKAGKLGMTKRYGKEGKKNAKKSKAGDKSLEADIKKTEERHKIDSLKCSTDSKLSNKATNSVSDSLLTKSNSASAIASASASSVSSKANAFSETSDARHRALVDRLFETYQSETGMNLKPVFNGSDGKAIKNLLGALPDIGVEELTESWIGFLRTDDEFHRKHIGQHPVRWWASRVNAFLSGEKKSGTSKTLRHNVRTGKAWLARERKSHAEEG